MGEARCGVERKADLYRVATEKVRLPRIRVVRSLKCYAERIAERLDALTAASQLDDDILLNEIRWISGLIAAFARYAEENFNAVERILSLVRD